MKTVTKIFIGILLLIIGVLAYLSFFDKSDNETFHFSKVTTIKTIYQDTGTHSVSIKPVPVYIEADTEWLPADTGAILADYHSKKHYDTLIVDNDTSLYIRVTAKVYKNELDSLSVIYANRRAIKQEITLPVQLCPENVFMLYSRLSIGGKTDLSIGGELLRKNMSYGVDYSPFTKTAGVKVGYLLFTK